MYVLAFSPNSQRYNSDPARTLRPFEEVQKEQRRKNLEVFTKAQSGDGKSSMTIYPSMLIFLFSDPSRITIGSWPDPDSVIFALGKTTDLSAIRIARAAVYGKDGTQIHPLDWEKTLIPNSEVAVLITSHLCGIILKIISDAYHHISDGTSHTIGYPASHFPTPVFTV